MSTQTNHLILTTLIILLNHPSSNAQEKPGEAFKHKQQVVQKSTWQEMKSEALEQLARNPSDTQAFQKLGRAERQLGNPMAAQRAILSILETAPRAPTILSRTGFVLLAEQFPKRATGLFQRALNERPDDPNLHRGLALSHWMNGQHQLAAEALEAGLGRDFNRRYGEVRRVFREELGYVYRAWIDATPTDRSTVKSRAKRRDVDLARTDALRITLCWDTDANDVDLHVTDPQNEQCFYQHKATRSGLLLYSDQRQGLGPEVIRTGKIMSGRYRVGVKYYSAGAMGKSCGVVVVLKSKNGNVQTPTIHTFTLDPNHNRVANVVDIDF